MSSRLPAVSPLEINPGSNGGLLRPFPSFAYKIAVDGRRNVRSESEILDLITNTARNDDKIRAAIVNGSRASLDAPRDIFQDFDIVYVVTDIPSFTNDPQWIGPGTFGRHLHRHLEPELRAALLETYSDAGNRAVSCLVHTQLRRFVTRLVIGVVKDRTG